MAPLSIKNLKKSYGAQTVLHGVDLEIDDGSFVVLLGPSGCGKSTLLRMIAGLESVTDGDVGIGRRRVNDVHPKDRDIAMVFQNYALYPHMTVYENMSFALSLAKRPQAEIKDKVAWAAEMLSLSDYLSRYPRQLSGGQRQRVAMGRAIVRDPAVFLFDEPLSNLDAKLRVKMRTEIKELHMRLGATTVYVTHDQIEAMTMADKIVILRDGRVEQEGAPLDVYDHPVNLFVAGFIGSPGINILPGLVCPDGFKADAGCLLPLPPQASAFAGRRALYGIRPEHIELTHGLEARVGVVEPTGAEMHIYADVGQEEICVVTDERVTLRPGDMLSWKPVVERVLLFDAETNEALPLGR